MIIGFLVLNDTIEKDEKNASLRSQHMWQALICLRRAQLTGPSPKRRCRDNNEINVEYGIYIEIMDMNDNILISHSEHAQVSTLKPQPFTDRLKDSNLEWAKCCGRMTVVKRYLSCVVSDWHR